MFIVDTRQIVVVLYLLIGGRIPRGGGGCRKGLKSMACSSDAGSCGGAGRTQGGGDGSRPPSMFRMVWKPGITPRGKAVNRK